MPYSLLEFFTVKSSNILVMLMLMSCFALTLDPAFRNSFETTLNGMGIRPCLVSLPSQAHAHGICDSVLSKLDKPSILTVFGYCILLLFKVDNRDLFRCNDYFKFNSRSNVRINKLREKVGCSPSKTLHIPFNEKIEYAIRTMLGTQALRTTVITFLMNNFDHSDSQIRSLFHYLSYVLSWSGDMRVVTVMNERLVKTNSLVLSDSLVTVEVDNLEETMKAIASHTYPQYFSHLCSVSELYYLDVSRFRTLFAVALEIDRTCDSTYDSDFKSEYISWNLKTCYSIC